MVRSGQPSKLASISEGVNIPQVPWDSVARVCTSWPSLYRRMAETIGGVGQPSPSSSGGASATRRSSKGKRASSASSAVAGRRARGSERLPLGEIQVPVRPFSSEVMRQVPVATLARLLSDSPSSAPSPAIRPLSLSTSRVWLLQGW